MTKTEAINAVVELQEFLRYELSTSQVFTNDECETFADYFDIVAEGIEAEDYQEIVEKNPFGLWRSLADRMGVTDENPLMAKYSSLARTIQAYLGSGNY